MPVYWTIVWGMLAMNWLGGGIPGAEASVSGSYPNEYDEVFAAVEGISRVRQADVYGYIGAGGEILVKPQFAQASDFQEGRARVGLEGKAGFIDRKGEMVVPLIYDRVWSYADGLAMVRLQGLYGFLDKGGAPVIPVQFPYAQSAADSMVMILLGDRYGFMDSQGAWRITPQYDEAWPFFNGKAKVREGTITFYVDKNGRCVLGCAALQQQRQGTKKN